MCKKMGALRRASHQANAFHKSVELIAAAPCDHDKPPLMEKLGATLKQCTGCHVTWKERLMDVWMKLTSTLMPVHPH